LALRKKSEKRKEGKKRREKNHLLQGILPVQINEKRVVRKAPEEKKRTAKSLREKVALQKQLMEGAFHHNAGGICGAAVGGAARQGF